MPGKARKLKPLKVSCTSSDCDNSLHCFKATKKMMAAGQSGQCRECKADLVDWERIYQRDVHDVAHTFAALKLEMFRHHMWHVDVSQHALNYARRKGKIKLHSAAKNQLKKLVGSHAPAFDGRQTPRETSKNANIIHYAQHATASCCRKCMEYWHRIPQGQELTDDEIAYVDGKLLNQRYRERKTTVSQDQKFIETHSTEVEVNTHLPSLADRIVDGARPVDKLTLDIVNWLQQT